MVGAIGRNMIQKPAMVIGLDPAGDKFKPA